MADGGSVKALFEENEKERLKKFTFPGTHDGTKYVGTEKPILAMLNEFRKDEKTGFCDVIIEVEGVDLSAHRCILAANSELFYNMFNSGMRESGERRLKLQSVSHVAMSSLLEFFYTREITIAEGNLEDILDAASFLLVKPVQQACIQILTEKLGSSNCFVSKHLAERYDATELLDKADRFTKKNFSRVARESDEFLSISNEELCSLISSDEILVESEEDVYSAVMRWINYDKPNRKGVFPKLLSYLRFGSLTKPFIRRQLESEPLVKTCEESKNVMEMWIKVKTKKKKTKGQKLANIRPSTKAHEVVVSFYSEDVVDLQDVIGFDVNTRERIRLPCLPHHQSYPKVAVISQTVYIVGGNRMSSLSLTSSSNQSLAWEKKASYSETRSAFAVAVLGKYIYMLGGLSPSHSTPCGTVERYDTNADTWEIVSPLCDPRGNLGAVGMQNFVLAIGGCGGCNKGSSKIVEKYNPTQNSWVQVAPLKVERSAPHTASYHNKVYATGGSNSTSQLLISCEVYNPRLNEWSLITNVLHPHEEGGLLQLVGTFPINDILHACFADYSEDKVKVLRLNPKSCTLEKSEKVTEIIPEVFQLPYKAFVVQVPKFHLELLPDVDDSHLHMMDDDDPWAEFHDDYSDFFDEYDDYDDDYDDGDDYYADWGGDQDPDWLL